MMKLIVMMMLLMASGRAEFRPNPEIYSLHITSDIRSRFATTIVTSYLANRANEAKEATFNVRLPKAAFITNFTMEIEGQIYNGEVKEKLQAKKAYEKAKSKGQTAGHVSQKARDTQAFKVAVNIAAYSKITFNLTYEELLQRRLGVYEHIININPQQIVQDLRVTVEIQESKEISLLTAPPLRRDVNDLIQSGPDNPLANIEKVNPYHAIVTFNPTPDQQKEVSDIGIAGQFLVNYDVHRSLDAGELQVVDGYFVHYFAPTYLEPVPKDIVFIIDSSGSMSGKKIEQTKQAMRKILADLHPRDRFTVIDFDSHYTFWQTNLLPATPTNKRQAINFVKRLVASGGTNIHSSMTEAVKFLLRQKALNTSETETDSTRTMMIFFLTDGMGDRPREFTINAVKELNKDEIAIFALGFGRDSDTHFLTQLSLQNKGFFRHIYEDADANLQLEGFYNEISTPLLTDVNIVYLGDSIDMDSLTETNFNTFFKGSEIVIAGKLSDNAIPTLSTEISASGSLGEVDLDLEAPVWFNVSEHSERSHLSRITERLWAYLTIKKLLDQMNESDNTTVKEAAEQRALELSLKYNFVTPLTSMIVIKPEDPKKDIGSDEDDDAEKPRKQAGQAGTRGQPSALMSKQPAKKGFVDNDPHFKVHINGLKEGMCFDVMGKPGDIFQLIQDPLKGITVNGEVIGMKEQPTKAKGHHKTWFGKINIACSSTLQVLFTPEKIQINSRSPLSWKKGTTVEKGPVHIKVIRKNAASVTCGTDLKFTVLRHKVHREKHPEKVDFLGFYIQQGTGFSRHTHGLIGQFLHQSVKMAPPEIPSEILSSGNQSVTYNFQFLGPHASGHPVQARYGKRRNMDVMENEPCWFVRKNGAGLIDGKVKDYLVPHLRFYGSSMQFKILMKKLPMFSHYFA